MIDVELFNKVCDHCEIHDINFRYYPAFEEIGLSPFLIIDKNGVRHSFSNLEEVCDYLEIDKFINEKDNQSIEEIEKKLHMGLESLRKLKKIELIAKALDKLKDGCPDDIEKASEEIDEVYSEIERIMKGSC